eukprot:jgi/Mesvir1/13867/Mv16008-RA.2
MDPDEGVGVEEDVLLIGASGSILPSETSERAEAFLVAQEVVELPDCPTWVVPLKRGPRLVGLLVVENLQSSEMADRPSASASSSDSPFTSSSSPDRPFASSTPSHGPFGMAPSVSTATATGATMTMAAGNNDPFSGSGVQAREDSTAVRGEDSTAVRGGDRVPAARGRRRTRKGRRRQPDVTSMSAQARRWDSDSGQWQDAEVFPGDSDDVSADVSARLGGSQEPCEDDSGSGHRGDGPNAEGEAGPLDPDLRALPSGPSSLVSSSSNPSSPSFSSSSSPLSTSSSSSILSAQDAAGDRPYWGDGNEARDGLRWPARKSQQAGQQIEQQGGQHAGRPLLGHEQQQPLGHEHRQQQGHAHGPEGVSAEVHDNGVSGSRGDEGVAGGSSNRGGMMRFRTAVLAVARTIALACVLDQRSSVFFKSSMQKSLLVGSVLEKARGPLQAIRTLGSMLMKHLERGQVSRDLASGIMVQEERVTNVFAQLESNMPVPGYPSGVPYGMPRGFDDRGSLASPWWQEDQSAYVVRRVDAAMGYPMNPGDGAGNVGGGSSGVGGGSQYPLVRPAQQRLLPAPADQGGATLAPVTRLLPATHTLAMGACDLLSVLNPLAAASRGLAAQQRIEFKLTTPPELPLPRVLAEAVALRGAISNVVDFALKHTVQGGSVLVDARPVTLTSPPSPSQAPSFPTIEANLAPSFSSHPALASGHLDAHAGEDSLTGEAAASGMDARWGSNAGGEVPGHLHEAVVPAAVSTRAGVSITVRGSSSREAYTWDGDSYEDFADDYVDEEALDPSSASYVLEVGEGTEEGGHSTGVWRIQDPGLSLAHDAIRRMGGSMRFWSVLDTSGIPSGMHFSIWLEAVEEQGPHLGAPQVASTVEQGPVEVSESGGEEGGLAVMVGDGDVPVSPEGATMAGGESLDARLRKPVRRV